MSETPADYGTILSVDAERAGDASDEVNPSRAPRKAARAGRGRVPGVGAESRGLRAAAGVFVGCERDIPCFFPRRASGGGLLSRPRRGRSNSARFRTNWARFWSCRRQVLPHGLAVCPGHDQRVLNSVFMGRWSNIEDKAGFKRLAPHSSHLKGDAIHFHHHDVSPAVAELWKDLMARAPDIVARTCSHVY